MSTENPTDRSLVSRASQGAFWAFTSNITVSFVSFVGTAVLARLLDPKDFGLLGMAVLVTGIVQLFGSLGLGGALIQKRDTSQEGLSTVFWTNLVAGLALTVLCMAVSPLAAIFFREQAVQSILLLLSGTFFVSSLSSIQQTLIYKELRMRQLAVIEVTSRLVRVLSMLIAAFLGFGYWSLAIGIVVERIVKTASFLMALPWKPSLAFSTTKFREFFRFGRNLFANGFLTYLNRNMDFLVTGRLLGVELLGFYQMAFNLPFLILQYVSSSIGSVSFPVFCSLQEDHERLAAGYLRIVRFIALGTAPVLVGLAICAEDFIRLAYGPRWLPAVAPLRLLCLSAVLASINSVVVPLLNAKGRPDLSLKWNCVRLPVTLVAIVGGARLCGILGVAGAMLLVEVLSVLLVAIAFHLLEQDIRRYFRCLLPSAVACTLMVMAILGVNQLLALSNSVWPVYRLLLNVLVGASAFFAVVILLFGNDWKELKQFTRQMIRKKG